MNTRISRCRPNDTRGVSAGRIEKMKKPDWRPTFSDYMKLAETVAGVVFLSIICLIAIKGVIQCMQK